MIKKLHVGNLSFETTEADVRELFAQAGVVGAVRIITDRDTGRSKGFGFVEMEDGGDKAVAQLSQRPGIAWSYCNSQRRASPESTGIPALVNHPID